MRVYYFTDTGKIHLVTEVLQNFDPGEITNLAYLDTSVTLPELSDYVIQDGRLVPETGASTEYKEMTTRGVNNTVGAARALFITDVVGQEMTYLAKQTEAKELLAMEAEPADPSAFPFLFAELGITGASITEIAQIVLNLSYQWGLIGSNLEKIRMGANAEIATAATRVELLAIQSSFKTNLGNLLASVGRSLEEIIHE